MASSENTRTIDHDEIREWVEARNGFPAAVRGTEDGDLVNGDPGTLRIDLPGGAGEEELKPLSWDDWLDKFDGEELAFVYQERKAPRLGLDVLQARERLRTGVCLRPASRVTGSASRPNRWRTFGHLGRYCADLSSLTRPTL